MLTAPGDSFIQGISSAAGPEDELVAGSFLINKVFDQWSVGFAELRPLAEAEGSVKVYGDDLI